MTPEAVETILDILTFAGIALLAVPVLTLDRRKARAARKTPARMAEGAMRRLRARADARIAAWVVGWRRLDRACLWLGYLMLLGASLGRVFL